MKETPSRLPDSEILGGGNPIKFLLEFLTPAYQLPDPDLLELFTEVLVSDLDEGGYFQDQGDSYTAWAPWP